MDDGLRASDQRTELTGGHLAISGTPDLIFYGALSASLSLYIDGLPADLTSRIMVLPPGRMEQDFVRLAAARLVIFVRGFEGVVRSGLLAALERVGVPCAWFTDDDLTMLRHEQPGFGYYSAKRVDEFLDRLVAVIGTSPPLCHRLSTSHPNVQYWPCVLNEALLPASENIPGMIARVAFVGGAFRFESLKRVVLPALEALPQSELFVVDGPAAGIGGERVLPFEIDFNRFIFAWRAVAPNILVHPPGLTRNIRNKAPGILLTALYLGAAPIVGDEPAFQGLAADPGIFCAKDTNAWRDALMALSTSAARQEYLSRLLVYARTAWTPDLARRVIENLLIKAAPGGSAAQARQNSARALGWTPSAAFLWRDRLQRLVRLSR